MQTIKTIDVIYAILIPIWSWMIFNCFWSRKQAGRLLLSFHQQRRNLQLVFSFITAFFMLFSTVFYVFASRVWSLGNAMQIFSSMLGTIWFLVFGFTNQVSIREKGFWSATGLIKWKQINSCQWREDSVKPNDFILVAKYKTLLGLNILHLPVSASQKQAADDLLYRYLRK